MQDIKRLPLMVQLSSVVNIVIAYMYIYIYIYIYIYKFYDVIYFIADVKFVVLHNSDFKKSNSSREIVKNIHT
jgi:hypothetical protein